MGCFPRRLPESATHLQGAAEAGENALAPCLDRQRKEKVIVNLDDILGPKQGSQRSRESMVDPEGTVQLVPLDLNEIESVMVERSQGAVGEASIVLVIILLGEV
jgi:hypothetical protein